MQGVGEQLQGEAHVTAAPRIITVICGARRLGVRGAPSSDRGPNVLFTRVTLLDYILSLGPTTTGGRLVPNRRTFSL